MREAVAVAHAAEGPHRQDIDIVRARFVLSAIRLDAMNSACICLSAYVLHQQIGIELLAVRALRSSVCRTQFTHRLGHCMRIALRTVW